MSIRNLEYLFQPRSVAVVGASRRNHSVGATVMANLLAGGFGGTIMPVNPKYDSVAGVLCYRDIGSLPKTPDLAVICTPPATLPELVGELGSRGARAAIVLTAGLHSHRDCEGVDLQQAMLEAARPHLLRILGPNCVGLMVPGIGLNASFAHTNPLSGKIAFVSQSGALTTAVLDWAKQRNIGFSHFVSLGNSADVDFGDVLDFLGSEPGTRSVLLYIESIKQARKFMSAARAAARNKVVLAVKSGRMAEGARAAASHTGALAGADEVYDAAIARAGMLRVDTIEDLFDAVETLARARPTRGDRLAILTNGGGPAVMATDALIHRGGRLAGLSKATVDDLDRVLPSTWSRANPVDIIGDAPAERYVHALQALLGDREVDAVVFIHAPTAIVPSDQIAEALVPVVQSAGHTVLACWLGGQGVAAARRRFTTAGIPTYDTPEDAVRAFMHMVNYRRNQEILLETPASVPEAFNADKSAVSRLVREVLAAGRDILSEPEAKAVLAAYGIPVVETRVAGTVAEATDVAGTIGFPVALKILSPDITHKSDVGGVVLDLENADEVGAAADAMLERARKLAPRATLEGFTVQAMARRPRAHELIAGAYEDAVFGPVLLFGQGGTAVEVIADRAVALPPLNMSLAAELVSRTRVARLLAGYRDREPADRQAILLTLMKLSQLIADISEIVELDINPLLADERGVLALDARIRVASSKSEGTARLAIRPYPHELEENIDFQGEALCLRPIKPEDEPQHRFLFSQLGTEDIRFRFFGVVRQLTHSELARYTQIDYDREMAFIATRKDADGEPETLGVVRAVADPDNVTAEFAIIVRSDLKGRGLGSLLLEKLIRYCHERGTREIVGQVLSNNKAMLGLATRLGFERRTQVDTGIIEIGLRLSAE